MADRDPFWDLLLANLREGAVRIFNWLVRYPVAAIIAAVVVVVGVMLLTAGVDVNIGGIIKYLFGRPKGSESVIAAANTVPDKRVDEQGDEIPVGTADERGWTQWEVREFKTSANPLRDREEIVVTKPDGTEHTVRLPTGIKDTDVDRVIEVKPEVYVLRTRSESAQSAGALLRSLPRPK